MSVSLPILTDRLERCYTGVLHDTMRAMGLSNFVLPRTLRPLDASQKLVGPIMTIEGISGTFDAHETLVAWTGLLGRARPGHVLVCQPNNDMVALMGELSGETLKRKGVRGYVADGGCRDCDFLLEMQFPVWHRFFTPKDIVGQWLPTHFDQSIAIGDVRIESGDFFVGDRDGALVVPSAQIEAVLAGAEHAIGSENKVRTAILAGMDPQQAYLTYGKF